MGRSPVKKTYKKNRLTASMDDIRSNSADIDAVHPDVERDEILPVEYFVKRAYQQQKHSTDEWDDDSPEVDENQDEVWSEFIPDSEEDSPYQDKNDLERQTRGHENPSKDRLVEAFDPNDPVSLYFREVNKVPLLSHEEEISLAKRIEAGRKARATLAEGSVTEKQETELRNLVEDGWAAREHLITANFRLVISVAKKYIGRGVPFLDLIQDGNIGLIRATKKFDFHRGYRFSTYATWWIRQAVSRSVADHGRTIRLPVHLGDQINRLWRKSQKLTQELGRKPTIDEIGQALSLTSKKVEELMTVSQRTLSLELSTSEDEDNELSDYTPDEIIPAPVDSVDEKIMQEHVRRVLETLPPREARILQLRYGLLDGKSHTLGEVGSKLGVTRERVRQIEAQALRRLRKPKLQRQLQDYLRD